MAVGVRPPSQCDTKPDVPMPPTALALYQQQSRGGSGLAGG